VACCILSDVAGPGMSQVNDLYLFPSLDELRTLASSAVVGLRPGYRSSWFLDLLAQLGIPSVSAEPSRLARRSSDKAR
jgi:hypothetical protein